MRISHENFYENRFQKMNLWCHKIFFRNFDFKNGFKNKFENENEKIYTWSRNRVSNKSDFEGIWTHELNPKTWELNDLKIWKTLKISQAVNST